MATLHPMLFVSLRIGVSGGTGGPMRTAPTAIALLLMAGLWVAAPTAAPAKSKGKGKSCAAALGSPFSMAESMRVASLISD